jgi:hypothetical protein
MAKDQQEHKVSIAKALVLSASHAALYKLLDDNFWGSETDIDLGNRVYGDICKIVGFDINEAEADAWPDMTKATTEEIIALNIEGLLNLPQMMKYKDGPLYAVVIEAFYQPNEWPSVANDEVESDLWGPEYTTVDRGWSEEQAQEIGSLAVGEFLLGYGDHAHSIFRVA